MSIKINNQDIVAINKGNQVITEVYKGTDLVWQLVELGMDDDIFFKDPEVGRVLHVNGLIADPIKSSKRELSRITSLRTKIHEMHSYFYNNEIITKFPELKYLTGLTSLAGAFSKCINLIEVGNIPRSVTNMWGTFMSCRSLTTVGAIPEGVTNMKDTFIGCSSLVNAPTIPEGVTIMNGTFDGCKSLIKAPIIPESVTDMYGTFYSCYSLIEAPVIPEGVTSIRSTFRFCESLIEAPIIPEGVIDMNTTFDGCKSLIEAPIIPEGVTDMAGAFSGCTNLDGVFVIKPVTPPIYSYTFQSVNVRAIYVPDESVSSYKSHSDWRAQSSKIYPMSEMDGYDSFFEDPEVGRVLHARGVIANANQSSIEELATITSLNPSGSISHAYFYGNQVITKFPELKYCTGLSSLRYAFFGCSNLTEVGNIPEGVTNMYGTFMFCSSLIEAPAIPEGVTNMYSTFDGCTSLVSAPTIPESVTDMTGTFRNCTSIDGIFVIKPVTPPMYEERTFQNVYVVAIYVPDESVDTYKTASGWSDHSSQIKPMSQLPQ